MVRFVTRGILDQSVLSLATFGALAVPVGLDSVPPTVAITVDTVLVTNAAGHQFTVTYTDETAMDLGTIDGSELLITGPNAYSENPTVVSSTLSGDGLTATVVYAAPGPGMTGLWDGGNNYGDYSIEVVPNKVADAARNYLPAGDLGAFEHLGEIVFTTTATNQIDPLIRTSDGSIVRWDLGTAANSLGAQIITDENSPTFSYTAAGTNTMTLRGRLNKITRIDFDNDGLTNITGQIEDLITIDRISINSNAVAMDVAPLLQHDSMTYFSARGNSMVLTGTINSVDLPPNMVRLSVGGNNQEMTGLINSTTTPASMVHLEINGDKQTFTGQFDSANAPPNMRNFNATGAMNQLTGRWDSADAPSNMRTLSVNGDMNQFTGVFNSVDAPRNMIQLNLGGDLHTFTGLFDSVNSPPGLRTVVFAGDLNAFTGAISGTGYKNLETFTSSGANNLFTGLDFLATTPVQRILTDNNLVTQANIDAAFDAFIAAFAVDPDVALTSWTISAMPFAPSGTRVADLAALGVTIVG